MDNLFFETMIIMINKVMSSIWVHSRKGKLKLNRLTAQQVREDTNTKKILHSNIGYRDFEALCTSLDYKEKLKKSLFAMIKKLGSPTFFLTFFELRGYGGN